MALEAETQGRAFLSATRAAWPHEGLEALARRHNGIVALPVTVGVTAALHGIGLPLILAGSGEGFVIQATVPATGTWTWGCAIDWDEVASTEIC